MSSLSGRRILLTGASSGIGEATARRLSEAGASLMLAARREDRLISLCESLQGQSAQVHWVRCDVTQRDQVESAVEQTVERFGGIDVLINNAGLMPLSFFSQGKIDEWERMIDVNLKGVLYGITAALPHFRTQGAGHFINVASVAGHVVFPTGGVYCATKHAVRALTEGLRQEEPTIRTTLISPGAVATELLDQISDPKLAMLTKAGAGNALPAAQIAEAILWALTQPPEVDINEIILRPVNQKA